jgi:hypothetical protein
MKASSAAGSSAGSAARGWTGGGGGSERLEQAGSTQAHTRAMSDIFVKRDMVFSPHIVDFSLSTRFD